MQVIYQQWLEGKLGRNISNETVVMLMEADIAVGRLVCERGLDGVLEIGCGFALPSIVIARLGGAKEITAFDLDLDLLNKARKMVAASGERITLDCRDFDCIAPPAGPGWGWIAVKPRGVDGGDGLMERIVVRGVQRQVSLVLVPRYGPEAHSDAYGRRCRGLAERLRGYGYGVEVHRLHKRLPLQAVVAMPREMGTQG